MRHAWGRGCTAAIASLLLMPSSLHILLRCEGIDLIFDFVYILRILLQQWTGTHFVRRRTALKDLGLRIQLNHPPGKVCPYKRAGPGDFVLYNLNGVHEISVDFCGCRTEDGTDLGGEPLEQWTQLLRACWWPATIISPKTCATFAVLRLFHMLNCIGKLSAYDFLRGLEKCTNHDGLDRPPVSFIKLRTGIGNSRKAGPAEAVHAHHAAVARSEADEEV